jgi:hypothetical protein
VKMCWADLTQDRVGFCNDDELCAVVGNFLIN